MTGEVIRSILDSPCAVLIHLNLFYTQLHWQVELSFTLCFKRQGLVKWLRKLSNLHPHGVVLCAAHLELLVEVKFRLIDAWPIFRVDEVHDLTLFVKHLVVKVSPHLLNSRLVAGLHACLARFMLRPEQSNRLFMFSLQRINDFVVLGLELILGLL